MYGVRGNQYEQQQQQLNPMQQHGPYAFPPPPLPFVPVPRDPTQPMTVDEIRAVKNNLGRVRKKWETATQELESALNRTWGLLLDMEAAAKAQQKKPKVSAASSHAASSRAASSR